MKSLIILMLGAALAVVLISAGCENDYPSSVWDPNYNSKPTPVIDSVEPAFSFSGIGQVTITGSNFSPVVQENTVYFNGKKGKTLSATATEIVVQAPVLVADSATIKVHVAGAFLFGEYKPYQLKEAALTYKAIDSQIEAFALAVDPDENIYVIANNQILQIVDPDSPAVVYGTTTFSICDNMRWAPDGALLLLRGNRFIYRVDPGGGAASTWIRFADVNDRISTGDFDQNGNLYCGGRSQKIFAVSATGDTTTVFRFPDYRYMAIRVYDGYVYTAATYDGDGEPAILEGIWRHQILDATGTLGAQELVYDWGSYAGELGPSILSMEFDENGLMYLGLDIDNAIVNLVISGGSPTPLYPEILLPPTTNMVWGNATFIYINRHETDSEKVDQRRIIRLEMPFRGAPSYGRP